MAKMFYTLEEAAARLGMGEDEVTALGESGQLQEFRDRDRLMFKRDQVDLLAGDEGIDDDDMPDEIRLADSGELEPMSLSSSGSGSAFNATPAAPGGSASGDTGISIFDPDDTGDADANADTLITGAQISPADLAQDASSSGSGLAQLSLEPDDTSLGSDLLSDLGGTGGDTGAGFGTASGTGAGTSFGSPAASGAAALSSSEAGSLFEGDAGAEPEFAAAGAGAAMMPVLEEYDGTWSGIAAGASVGMILMLVVGLAATILGFTGAGASSVLAGVDSTMVMIIAGGGAALIVLTAAIGWVLLRKG